MGLLQKIRWWLPQAKGRTLTAFNSVEDLGDAQVSPASATQRIKTWPEVIPQLFSELCPAMTAGAAEPPAGGPILCRERLPFLVEVVGIREGCLETLVTEAHVRAWGIGADDAFQAAQGGKVCTAECLEVTLQESLPGYRIWRVEGDLAVRSGEWLRPGWLEGFRDKIVGAPVAILPNRTTLFVGGDGDNACLVRLLELAETTYRTSSAPMSTELFATNPSGLVVPLRLAREHPLAHAVDLRQRRFAESQYERQKMSLQDRVGDSLFVAAYMVLEGADGGPVSVAAWSAGGPSLLPKVDEIAFVLESEREQSEVFRVEWDTVRSRVGDLLTPLPDHVPERYLAREWPAEEILKQLKSIRV